MLVAQTFIPSKKQKLNLFTSDMNSHKNPMSIKRKNPEASNPQNGRDYISKNNKVCLEYEFDNKSSITGSLKNTENGKHRKMGIIEITQCFSVLKALMSHPTGWVFNQPVDPIKLNIPDYFKIITNPMDLGTVKDRLERKYYFSSDEFAADIKLTFSNAMRYNPPDNDVHKMAKNLDKLFSTKWKCLEAKQRKECQIFSQRKSIGDCKQVLQRAPSCNSYSTLNKILTTSEKVNLQSTLEKYSRGNCPPQLLNFLQKVGLHCHSDESNSIDIYAINDEILWELHQIINKVAKAGPRKAAELMKGSPRLLKECSKGITARRLTTSSKESLASTITDDCTKSFQLRFNADNTSSHKKIIKRPSSDDFHKSSNRCSVASQSTPATLDDKKNIKVHARNDNSCTSSTIGTAITEDAPHSPVSCIQETDYLCKVQLSPTKALRAAMLKSRFADTILMARQKTHHNNDANCDPAQIQREKEKLKRQQLEEKRKIEAQIKAAETAAQMKAKAKQLQRERERQDARLALEKVERTIDFLENTFYCQELAKLAYIQTPPPDYTDAKFMHFTGKQGPLLKLGLLIKDDKEDGEFGECVDIEDGEIV